MQKISRIEIGQTVGVQLIWSAVMLYFATDVIAELLQTSEYGRRLRNHLSAQIPRPS